MKRIGKKFLGGILTVLCALCFLLAACGDSDEITFRFETNGGDPIAEVTVEQGTQYTLPIPTKEGGEFEGWYDNAEFSGEAVVTVEAQESKTFYAKWAQMYQIELDLDGGTLDGAKIYVKNGTNIYNAVKDLVPAKNGWQFGEWYMNGAALPRNAAINGSDVKLTARYKVGYTIKIFEQNLTQTGYDPAEDVIGYEYITGEEFTPTVEKTGFALSAEGHSDAITSKVLTENMADNVFRLYFDRQELNVTFFPNYPEGEQGDPIQRKVLAGTEIEFPDAQLSAEGYLLYGWNLSSGGNQTFYESHYIDSVLINGEHDVAPTKVKIEDESVFTAVWSKGYTDMMKSEDVIYHFSEDDTVCYLERCGKYFSGEFNARNSRVTFYDEYGDIFMEGKLKDDGTFIYANPDRQDLPASYYEVGKDINNARRIYLDECDGIMFDDAGNVSEGEYSIDGDNNYHITFTSGYLQGETRIMRLITTTVDGNRTILFQFRNEEEYAMPILQRAVVAAQSGTNVLTYYINDLLSIDLDGYGNATMNMGSSTQTYYYMYDGTTLTLLNSNGNVYGVCRLITVDEYLCYIPYNAAMAVTYTAEDGSTLTLDGMHEATYLPAAAGEGSFIAQYTVSSSVFGGTIVTLMRNNITHKFIVNTQTTGEGEDAVTTYTFETRPAGYAEYYYANGSNYPYYTPFIVMNDTEMGRASIYGYTEQEEFLKVAEGDVEYNQNALTYSLTVDSDIPYPEAIIRTPVDLENISIVVFGLGTVTTSSSTRSVSYWYSMTKTGAGTPETTTYDKTYTGTYDSKAASITLVGGFAIWKVEGENWRAGAYSTSGGVTTVNIGLTENTSRFYIELNEEGTFIVLTGLLGSARERNADGTASTDVTFEFDGKGHGTLVTAGEGDAEDTRVEGTITVVEGEEVEGVEGTVYQFTPNDDPESGFRFIMLTSQNGAYFTRETKGYAGEYTETDGTETLVLDGYGFRAKYTLASGRMIEGIYAVREENIIRVTTDEGNYYFDISGRNFVIRGSEYGSYLFVNNYAYDGYLLRLDGHGSATLTGPEEDAEPITGTYTQQEGIFTITFNVTSVSISVKYVGQLGYLRVSSTDYNAFLVEYTDAKNIYVDEENDWTVLRLDGYGNAVRYGMYGSRESGTYILITDTLLYYANTAGTDACIYEYDAGNGIVTMRQYEAQGYYTENLDALLFSRYGFMVFNGETRYYYDVNEDNEVTIYRRAFGTEGANDYGFLTIPIGVLDASMNFGQLGEDFGSETYYSANGYAITFKRAETDTTADGKVKYPVRVGTEDENTYPLADLTFAPTGSQTFTVAATVNINGQNYSGRVYRSLVDAETGETEIYFVNGNFRFDLEVTYLGANQATYKITQMRYIQTYQSNMYLETYLMALLLMNVQVRDTVGTISIVTEYHEDGTVGTAEEGMQYMNSAFGADSVLHAYEFDKVPYTYNENTGVYTVVLPEPKAEEDATADEYEYRVNFALQLNQYSMIFAMLGYGNVVGYTILGYTRVEQVTATDAEEVPYTVTVEHILATESSAYHVGDYFTITIETEDEEIPYDHLLSFSQTKKYYYIVYTYEDGEVKDPKVTAATYYELVFTEQTGGAVGDDSTVYKIESATVKKIEATVYYTELGSYMEVLEGEGENGTDLIVHVYYSQDYTVSECEYNEETKTFDVTTSTGRQLKIKIVDEVNKIIEITEVTSSAT